MIFGILRHSKIAERLDSSQKIWKNHDFYKPELQKQVGLYEIESINNPTILTISMNPKEYYEEFRNRTDNKRYKGINKNELGMDFERYGKKKFVSERYL